MSGKTVQSSSGSIVAKLPPTLCLALVGSLGSIFVDAHQDEGAQPFRPNKVFDLISFFEAKGATRAPSRGIRGRDAVRFADVSHSPRFEERILRVDTVDRAISETWPTLKLNHKPFSTDHLVAEQISCFKELNDLCADLFRLGEAHGVHLCQRMAEIAKIVLDKRGIDPFRMTSDLLAQLNPENDLLTRIYLISQCSGVVGEMKSLLCTYSDGHQQSEMMPLDDLKHLALQHLRPQRSKKLILSDDFCKDLEQRIQLRRH